MLDGANRVISFAEFFFNRLITHLDVAELALDHPKRMLHLDTDTSLEFLGLLNESASGLLLPALAGAQDYAPIHARCFCSLR